MSEENKEVFDEKKVMFSVSDIVKFSGFVALVLGQWYDLKMEIQKLGDSQREFEKITNLKIENIRGYRGEKTSFYMEYINKEAILPEESKRIDQLAFKK